MWDLHSHIMFLIPAHRINLFIKNSLGRFTESSGILFDINVVTEGKWTLSVIAFSCLCTV